MSDITIQGSRELKSENNQELKAPSIKIEYTYDVELIPKLTGRVMSESGDRPFPKIKVSSDIDNHQKTQGLSQQLRSIEQRTGITIERIDSPGIWIEDVFIPLESDKTNTLLAANFNRDNNVTKALDKLEKYDLPEAATGQGRTAKKIGKNRTEAEQAAAEAIKQGIKVQESNVFLEGGNVLATGGKVIIGRSSIIVNSELLESRGQLDPQRISQIASSTNWDKDEMDLAIQMAKNTSPSDTPEKEIENTAKIILAKFELAKEFIAKDLNIDPKDIVTVSQPTFHIDIEMRPLSDNKILLNDPKLMNETIDKALRNTPLEKKTLLDMKYNEHELSALNYVLDRTQNELEKAGFEVIRAPGNSGQGRINKNSRIANISVHDKNHIILASLYCLLLRSLRNNFQRCSNPVSRIA